MKIPSKTFLVGEYVALSGGPSLVLTTLPEFTFSKRPIADFAEGSPSYNWLSKNQCTEGLKVEHPHPQPGGFGASTAEFIANCWHSTDETSQWTPVQWLDEYQSCNSAPASGADLVAQVCGGISFLDGKEQKSLAWPFSNLGVALFQTQNKVATHKHLQSIQDLDFSKLKEQSRSAAQAFLNADEKSFIDASRIFAEEQQRLGLLADETQELIATLHDLKEVVLARGCGALGADVIAVYYLVENRKFICEDWQDDRVQFIANEQHLSQGVHQ